MPKTRNTKPQRHADRAEPRQRGEHAADEDRHAGHALQRAERAQRADRADHRVVAEAWDEDRHPRQRAHDEVELAPRVAQVGVRVHRGRCHHLEQQLDGEDDEVDGQLHWISSRVLPSPSAQPAPCPGSSGESHAIVAQLAMIVVRISGSKRRARRRGSRAGARARRAGGRSATSSRTTARSARAASCRRAAVRVQRAGRRAAAPLCRQLLLEVGVLRLADDGAERARSWASRAAGARVGHVELSLRARREGMVSEGDRQTARRADGRSSRSGSRAIRRMIGVLVARK